VAEPDVFDAKWDHVAPGLVRLDPVADLEIVPMSKGYVAAYIATAGDGAKTQIILRPERALEWAAALVAAAKLVG
jgi:hypothetical protein